jgi:hypothetical protein
MREPAQVLAGLFEYVGVDAGAAAVGQVAAARHEALPRMSEHRTTPDPEASIGRYARDLDPALLAECERRLGKSIAILGYSLAGSAREA